MNQNLLLVGVTDAPNKEHENDLPKHFFPISLKLLIFASRAKETKNFSGRARDLGHPEMD